MKNSAESCEGKNRQTGLRGGAKNWRVVGGKETGGGKTIPLCPTEEEPRNRALSTSKMLVVGRNLEI